MTDSPTARRRGLPRGLRQRAGAHRLPGPERLPLGRPARGGDALRRLPLPADQVARRRRAAEPRPRHGLPAARRGEPQRQQEPAGWPGAEALPQVLLRPGRLDRLHLRRRQPALLRPRDSGYQKLFLGPKKESLCELAIQISCWGQITFLGITFLRARIASAGNASSSATRRWSIPHHETFSITIQLPYSSTKG